MSRSRTIPLKVHWDAFDRLTGTRGWKTDADKARGLGISPATISTIRSGNCRPGQKFVHSCLREFGGAAYDLLFEEEKAA